MDEAEKFPWLPVAPKKLSVKANSRPLLKKTYELQLGGKVICTVPPPISAIRADLYRMWKCKCLATIKDVTKTIFSVSFTNEDDRNNVLKGGPYFVGKNLVLIIEASENVALTHASFEWTKLWVRVYDLPPKGLTKDIADDVGSCYGGVVEYDLPADSEEELRMEPFKIKQAKDYLRVKVNINITQPLYKVLPLEVQKEEDEEKVENLNARIAYETLPEFCYCCGIIGHQFRNCPHYDGTWTADELPYSEDLRATKIYVHNNNGASFSRPPPGKYKGKEPVKAESMLERALPEQLAEEKSYEKMDNLINRLPVKPISSNSTNSAVKLTVPVRKDSPSHINDFPVLPVSAPTSSNSAHIVAPLQAFYTPAHSNGKVFFPNIHFGNMKSWASGSNATVDPAFLNFLASGALGLESEEDQDADSTIKKPVACFTPDLTTLQNAVRNEPVSFEATTGSFAETVEKKKKRKKKRITDFEEGTLDADQATNDEDDMPEVLKAVKGTMAKRTRSASKGKKGLAD